MCSVCRVYDLAVYTSTMPVHWRETFLPSAICLSRVSHNNIPRPCESSALSLQWRMPENKSHVYILYICTTYTGYSIKRSRNINVSIKNIVKESLKSVRKSSGRATIEREGNFVTCVRWAGYYRLRVS